MKFGIRVGLALILLGCFLSGMVVLGNYVPQIFPETQQVLAPGTLSDQSFTRDDFLYGPQSWRPHYDPMAIDPGEDACPDDGWYLMFIDLNGTPVSGNPDVQRVGALKVTYNFTELSGRAAFHGYQLVEYHPPAKVRTNRQEGYGRCGYVVTGTAAPGGSMPSAVRLPLSETHTYSIQVSNARVMNAVGDLPAETRELQFLQRGAGLGALRITPDLSAPLGGVTETDEQNGSFYVTSTGNSPGGELLLLVAVNQKQPDDFGLRVRSEFVEM